MDYITKYAFSLGKRRSRKEKDNFINEFVNDVKNVNNKTRIEFTSKTNKYNNSLNLGLNINTNSKYLLLIPYDTPLKNARKNNRYYPTNLEKQKTEEKKNLKLSVIKLITLVIIWFLIMYIFTGIRNHRLVSILIHLFFVVMIMIQLPTNSNRINLNRNSLAIILLLELLSNKHNPKSILIDNFYVDKSNLKNLNEFVQNNSIPIFIDCIGTGSNVVINYKLGHENEKELKDLLNGKSILKNKDENSYLKEYFNEYIYISSGEIDEDGDLYVLNTATKEDIRFNNKHYETVLEILKMMEV